VGNRERIVDAIAELSAERGYGGTSVGDIVRRAGVARKTLYDNFDGKEDAFLSALDSAIAEGLGRAEAACETADGDWRQRIEAGLGALLAYLSARPAVARMCMVEALSASSAASRRYDAALERFAELLRRNAPRDEPLPDTIAETLVGGVAWILNRKIRGGEAERAVESLPELSEFVLAPYRRAQGA
jgi:AcrR family transcriptional regulator